MSAPKPTPGPWSVQRESAIDYRPNLIVGADGGSLVAWCAGGGPKRAVMGPEEDANARLIAAAPDLLEAVRGLLEAWHDHRLDYLPELDFARAARDKAEGRS